MTKVPKMTTWRYRRDKRSLYKQRIAEMISSKDYFLKLRRLRIQYLAYLKSSETDSHKR